MENITFKQAFTYPFNRAKGLLNALWLLVPIFGWFVLAGYSVKIVNELLNKKFKELPKCEIMKNFKLGFFIFLKSLPFIIVYVIITQGLVFIHGGLEILNFLIDVFIVPLLMINFYKKQTIESFFEFKILNSVFKNLGEYILISFKTLGLILIFLLLTIVLVGTPALMFGTYIFYVQFYLNYVKSK